MLMNQTALLLGFMCKSITCARRHTSKLFTLVVLALLVQLASAPLVSAANLTWDADTGTSGAQDGAGTWSTNNANWWNGSTDIAWTNANGDSAIFGVGGTPGTVVLGGSVTVSNITFNNSYTLTSAGYAVNFTSGGGVITAATGTSNSFTTAGSGVFGGNVGWSLEGGGTVARILSSAGETYTGPTIIDNGISWSGNSGDVIYYPGDVIVNANGTMMFTGGSSTGGALGGNKVLILNGGTLFGTSNSKYLPVNKMVMDNGGQMQGLSITIMTNMDARSGLVGGGKGIGRYTFCTLAKSTAGTLTMTNQSYTSGICFSNVTLNAGLFVIDRTIAKDSNKRITGPLILAGGALILTNGAGAAAPA